MTKKFTIHFLICMLLFLTNFAIAQVVVDIQSPAAIAGKMQVAPARFGPIITDAPTVGEVVYVEGSDLLGCNPISIDLTGKIAMIDRGDCSFSLKAYHAQQAGAIAMMLAYEPGRELMFVLTPGDSASAVTIPVIGIIENDWMAIRQALLTEPVTVSIYNYDEFDGSTVVFEETFPGSLNGWTSVAPVPPDSHWVWTEDGGSEQVVFFVNSPTSISDGAAIFDASYFSRDVGPNPPYPDYTAELISPAIDVSAHNTLYLTFYQSNWPLNERNFPLPQTGFQYSIDDGVNWSPIIEIETENVLTSVEDSYHHTETVRLLLEDLNFTENLRLKFTFDGDYYIWALDDIRLVVPPENELAIESTFYPLIHYATPESHISTDTMGFRADIINGGLNDMIGNEVLVQVVHENGAVYHEETIEVNLPPFTRDTVVFNSYAPQLPQGNYELRYSLSNPNVTDEFPDNNQVAFPFVISKDVFAQELADQEMILRSYSNTANPYYWGGFFTVSTAAPGPCMFMGTQLAANAADGVLDTETFTLYLLKWVDNNDGYPDYVSEVIMDNVGPLEHPNFEIQAIGIVDLSGLDQNQLFEVNISDGLWIDENGSPLTQFNIEPGTYAVVGEFAGSEVGLAAVNAENLAGTPTVLYNINGGGTWSPGFVDNFFPVLRTTVQCLESTHDTELTAENARIYPSITNDEIQIDLNLDQRSDAALSITDMQGRVMIYSELGAVQNEQFTHSIGHLSAGMYLVNILTAEGRLQAKVTVVH